SGGGQVRALASCPGPTVEQADLPSVPPRAALAAPSHGPPRSRCGAGRHDPPALPLPRTVGTVLRAPGTRPSPRSRPNREGLTRPRPTVRPRPGRFGSARYDGWPAPTTEGPRT